VVKSGNTYTFYRNGVLDGTDSTTMNVPIINAPLEIGRAEGTCYFKGIIDEVRIYNYARSPSQILEDKNACRPGDTLVKKPDLEPYVCTDPDPPSHDFGSVPNGQTREWTFDITNCGAGTLTWTVSADKKWITVNPTSGSTTTETDTVTVSIDTTGLECGKKYTGTITVSSDGGTKQGTITVNVPEPEEEARRGSQGKPGTEPEGLVAYYPFNGNPNDESGNGNDGTKHGATWVDGRCKKALSFDWNGYVDCGKNPSITDDATIEAWVNFAASPTGLWTAFVSKDEGSGSSNKWIFGYSEGKTAFHVNDPIPHVYADVHVYSNEWEPYLNQWYHLAVVKSGNTYTFYRDGVADGTDSMTLAIPTINAPLEIGRAEGGNCFNGIIDEVRIYDYARSPSQILEDMKCPQPTPMPDLTPYEITWTPPNPTTSDDINITWKVKNQGNADAVGKFYTELYVDGERKKFWENDSLGVGQETSDSMNNRSGLANA
jgi:hypothetical protein